MRAALALGFGALVAGGLAASQYLTPDAAGDGPERLEDRTRSQEPLAPYSNIEPEDYVGPEACRECHTELYDQWRAHPHRRMNQNATPEAVVGDFSGVEADYGGIRTVFETREDAFFMSHYLEGVLVRRDRITRTIGSRLQQAYVGVQDEGPEPPEHPLYSTERALPYVYWFSRKAWFPEHFVEQYPEPELTADGELRYPTADPYSRGDRPWNEGCLLCHNTYPYTYRLGRDFPGRGFANVSMPAATRGSPTQPPTPDDLVTLGVSCESCHFGGREHVEHEREVRNYPSSPTLSAWTVPEGGPAVTSICAQCHVAGTLPYPNEASSVNSSEALDMLTGDCSSAIACTDCHDPHVANPPGGGPDRPDHVAACVRCHDTYEDETARMAHARHRASVTSCLDCHMQRITQGIDTVVRSHRIDSPTNEAMLAAGAPNACNLCHLDRSMAWTLEQLSTQWGSTIEPEPDWERWYGHGLESPVGARWLEHPTPVTRLVAADAFSRTPMGHAALPPLLEILLDEYPENRMFGMFAIERILGRRLTTDEYTPTAPLASRRRQVRGLRRSLRKGARAPSLP